MRNAALLIRYEYTRFRYNIPTAVVAIEHTSEHTTAVVRTMYETTATCVSSAPTSNTPPYYIQLPHERFHTHLLVRDWVFRIPLTAVETVFHGQVSHNLDGLPEVRVRYGG